MNFRKKNIWQSFVQLNKMDLLVSFVNNMIYFRYIIYEHQPFWKVVVIFKFWNHVREKNKQLLTNHREVISEKKNEYRSKF